MIARVRMLFLVLLVATALVASACSDSGPPQPRTVANGAVAAGTVDHCGLPERRQSDLDSIEAQLTALQDIPGLLGKTGTAEAANAPAHGWFVGISGRSRVRGLRRGWGVVRAGADSGGSFPAVRGCAVAQS